MKYSCGLIRDLLPLYCDQVCSKDSVEAVQEHISVCGECRRLCGEMKQKSALELSVDSTGYEKKQLKSMREVKSKLKKRNTVFGAVGAVAGILLAVAVIRILLVAGVIVFAVQEGRKESCTTSDVSEYGVFEKFDGYSRLDIFPEQIDAGMEAKEYYYCYADTFLDPTAQIYLECSYTQDSYQRELARLQGIREEHKGKVQTIVYDEEGFSYPAYVAIDAWNHCYEYALLLGEERIAYVFLQFIGEEEIVFPVEYLPRNYEQKDEGRSIYVFLEENGDGYGVY